MATFDDVIKAAQQLAADAQYATGIATDEGALKIVRKYSEYLTSMKEKKGETALDFATWVGKEENVKAATGSDKNEARDKSVKLATDYMTGEKAQAYNKVKDELFKGGQYVVDQAKGIGSQIWDGIKENGWAIGLGLLGLVGGNAMDLGLFGSIALAGLAAVVGGGLLDEGGLFSGLFSGGKPKGTPTVVSNDKTRPMPSITPQPALAAGKSFGKVKVQELKAEEQIEIPGTGGKKADKFIAVRTDDGKVDRYFAGTVDDKGVFRAVLVDMKEAKPEKGKEAGAMGSVPLLGDDGKPVTIELQTKDGNVEIDEATSNKLMAASKKAYDKRDAELKAAAATPKTIPEADVSMKPKLKDVMKDIPDGQVVEWVLSDKDTGDKMTVRGKKQGNEFIVLESSQQPKGSTTATTMRKQTEELKIPLTGDAQEIDPKKIVAAVKDDRTKEIKLAREAFIKDKVMALETVQMVKLEGETLTVSADATIKPKDGATAETTSTKTKMTVSGTIDATKADAPVMVIKKDSSIQVGDNVVKAPKDISIDIKGMDIAKLKAGDADQLKELNKRLAASADLTEVVKGNLPTASLPPQALPGMSRPAGPPSK